ncbi:rhomboid-related protein 4 isoform X2 [Monodelphis domestica]|uniref:Rhomboid-related protein 4 n=1 Tax=Monodelphis domestica TaxID=13616 RepID=A0A5F8GW25_MONDO|nr:rhomboid-related protein 4 isoform X2 [Monodelphis domestica]XP_016280764.1 rhomboid-related protein 4 isoform X2 [Monodelphis domestica]XP_016280767.1 rhomboid-related protein 4 isoform X2 [Monodelphis domestica]
MQRRSREIPVGVLLLASQMFQIGITNIPPVTLACLALNVWLFLSPLKPFHWVCLSVESCYEKKDWQRLLLSPFHHVDDWHLYFNMASLLWKGLTLERRLGSFWFAYVISVFSILIGVIYLALEYSLAELLDQPEYKMHCTIGFSGVLFALKVLNNNYNPGGHTNIMGLYIPNKYACWMELLMIHLLTPKTSFAGHLAGIIVGLLYVLGPLKRIMKAGAGIFFFDAHLRRQQYSFYDPGYRGQQGDFFDNQPYQEIPRNYYAYTAGFTEEEQLERALRDSLQDRVGVNNDPPPYGFNISPEDEMRRKRLNRFDRH